MPHAATDRGDEPGQTGGVVGIDDDAAGAAGDVAGAAAVPDEGLVGHLHTGRLVELPEPVARLVVRNGAVAGHLHLVEHSVELVGEAGLRQALAPLFEPVELGLELESQGGAGFGVEQGFLEAGLLGDAPVGLGLVGPALERLKMRQGSGHEADSDQNDENA